MCVYRIESSYFIISLFQELLSETSRGFHTITGGQSLIGDVQIILPGSWATGGGGECLSGKSSSVWSPELQRGQSDVLVTERHPIFGIRPWTSQYGQCGVQGLEIALPYPALTNNQTLDGSTVDRMLKEWIKFRFGVFEESGFVGDAIYPLFYAEGEDQMKNEGCANSTEVSAERRNKNLVTRASSWF